MNRLLLMPTICYVPLDPQSCVDWEVFEHKSAHFDWVFDDKFDGSPQYF